MSGYSTDGRMSTGPSDEPFDEDNEDVESDYDILAYAEGTPERQAFINKLNLTETPEERDKTMASIDVLIAAAMENLTSDDNE